MPGTNQALKGRNMSDRGNALELLLTFNSATTERSFVIANPSDLDILLTKRSLNGPKRNENGVKHGTIRGRPGKATG